MPRRIAVKNQTRFALAAALTLVIAGCSSTKTENGAPGVPTGTSAEETTPNLDFAARCPGVHYEKLQAWTDVQIMQQEKIKEGDIPVCEQWIAKQPPGYVPPVPKALVPGATANAPYEGRGNPGAGPDAGPPPAQVAP
jgi:hypothetical protein